jgi:hypothetical protein
MGRSGVSDACTCDRPSPCLWSGAAYPSTCLDVNRGHLRLRVVCAIIAPSSTGELGMNALSRFEELVERVVEGTLTSALGAQLQPVELARRVGRAMEAERRIGVGRAYAPNEYVVWLSPQDLAEFEPIQLALQRELAAYVANLAAERKLDLLGLPSVRLATDEHMGRRQIRVQARLVDQPIEPSVPPPSREVTQRFRVHPSVAASKRPDAVAGDVPVAGPDTRTPAEYVLRGADLTYPLDRPSVHLGRALDNDVVLEDSRVSRYHAELRLERGRVRLRDLRSTNGTFVNGEKIKESVLRPGDVVSLGGLELRLDALP